ncbi:MAG: lycopene cyclase family protein [Cyclobacteriaceae bacterium]
MSFSSFDIAIVGAGASGMQLAVALTEDPKFNNKEILIIESSGKNKNDRTWCFWEKGKGRWDEIIYRKWDETRFHTGNRSLDLSLSPYSYKMLRAIDFYKYCQDILRQHPNVTWVKDEVKDVSGADPVLIRGENTYQAKLVFDSRVHPDFHEATDSSIRLLQHFKGWVIETEEDVFDPNRFVMMDFRLIWKDSTSFTYILPFSQRRALVEFTLFSPSLLNDDEYESMLRTYIADYLGLSEYRITDVETGIIPMSDYPFHQVNTKNHIRIGTAGSWVKPSSGYSFKNSGKNIKKVIENMKAGKSPVRGLLSPKFRLYDAVFLNVLYHHNELGPRIFSDMYSKNPPQRILKFLDEETSLMEDVKIISSFQKGLFTRAFLRTVFR